MQQESPALPKPAPDQPSHSYDLAIKDITTWPSTVYIGSNYTMRVVVQRYGQQEPSGFHLNVLDGNTTLYDSDINDPGLIEWVEFPMGKATDEPRNIRAEVRSTDLLNPEPGASLSNNVMRKTFRPSSIGFYDLYNYRLHWYYDAVTYGMHQAQAFSVSDELDIHRIGLHMRAPLPNPNTTSIMVELHQDNDGKIGDPIASSMINAGEVGPESGWHYAYFDNLSLPEGNYWIVTLLDSTDGYGVKWSRAEGNPYGEMFDTQVREIVDWPEWDYKLFDFAFKIY
jgi:hypothetical protein